MENEELKTKAEEIFRKHHTYTRFGLSFPLLVEELKAEDWKTKEQLCQYLTSLIQEGKMTIDWQSSYFGLPFATFTRIY